MTVTHIPFKSHYMFHMPSEDIRISFDTIVMSIVLFSSEIWPKIESVSLSSDDRGKIGNFGVPSNIAKKIYENYSSERSITQF